ncbi:MAG TPA: hypothetical protein VHW23_36300 [Kofleriaceae bacterium]|nr:hypothetical protein [Kofleriaceae bacterium]
MDGHALDRCLQALVVPDYPSTLGVTIRPIGIEGESTEELDRIADTIGGEWCSRRHGEKGLVIRVRTSWNPWALHAALVRMCAWSERVPSQRLEVDFVHPGLVNEMKIQVRGTLRAGVFTSGNVPLAELDAWVSAHPRPRLAGHRVRATLFCWTPRTSQLRRSARSQAEPRNQVEIAELPGGLAFFIQRADCIAPVTREIGPAMPLTGTFELVLRGDAAWRCRVSDQITAHMLRLLLNDLLRDVPPSEPAPACAEIVLPPAPALGKPGPSEQLQLELEDGDWRVLAPDGSFASMPWPTRHVSADGRYRVQVSADDRYRFRGHRHAPPQIRLTDTVTGAVRDVQPDGRRYPRVPLGFVGSELVMVEHANWLDDRERIVLHAPDGTERTSREFDEIMVFTLDPEAARAYLVASRVPALWTAGDVPKLLAIDLHRFEETVLQTFPGAVPSSVPWGRDPHLLCHGGELFGLHSARETTLVRYARGVEVIARVGGELDHASLDGATLTLVTADLDLAADRCETFLHRLTLTGDWLGTVRLGLEPSVRFAAAGPWLAWHGRDSGRIVHYEGLEPCDEIAVPSGHRVSDLAVSPSGALACVLSATDRDTALLVVARDGQRTQLELPVSARVSWRACGSAAVP